MFLLSEYTLMGCLHLYHTSPPGYPPLHLCHSPNCQEMCCPCICPWHCQGIHLCLSHYINDSTNGGSPQDDGYSGHKIVKVQDD